MSKIQIANLQPAGTELFQGSESFLADLQPTTAHAIFGGGCKSGGKSGKKSGGKSGKKSGKSGSGSCYSPCPPPPKCY